MSTPEIEGADYGSTRRSFTAEYKANAVSLVIDDGRAIAEVARSIGVHEMALGKWVKKARDEGYGESDRPLNQHARMEVEFAKKVATWSAKYPRG